MRGQTIHRLILGLCAMPVLLAACTSTALLHSASEGDTKGVVAQLSKGGDPNTKIVLIGTPAIVLAAAEGHLDTVRTLVARGADVNAEDMASWTALHAAARNGHKEIVSFLLQHGATSKPATWYNPTPVYVAEKTNHPDIVKMLQSPDDVRRAMVDQLDEQVQNVVKEP